MPHENTAAPQGIAPEGQAKDGRVSGSESSGDEAGLRHFRETIGGVPESVLLLRRVAPELYRSYAETRARLYRAPPEGQLGLPAKELVFIVLDVVAGHVEGACAHASAGLAAGLTPGQIMEALEICILVHGHHTWAKAGMAVMQHVERVGAAS